MFGRLERELSRRAPDPTTVARVGLGLTILLAGVHKLFAPDAWAAYVVDWLAPWLVVSPDAFMLANGVLEVGFGLAILRDRYAAFAAAVVAISLTATVAYLAFAALTVDAPFVDVLVRDVGLTALAWAVLFESVSEREGRSGPSSERPRRDDSEEQREVEQRRDRPR
ncbi:DoxX family protein [Halomicrococcus sp. NG-SE-24]|uniref:DoxX family protein n=1 Tax=Halomicrococcus sp. NG-SE-24 TaxID=3436928 RepID=UPI003D96A1DB